MKKLRLCVLLGVFILSWATLAQAVSVPYIIDLPSPFNQSMGRAINANDQMVGEMWIENPSGPPWGSPVHPWVPFIFYGSGTAMALTGYDAQIDYLTQDLSNDARFVVGYAFNNPLMPWVWDQSDNFRQLPVPTGYISAQAIRIEDSPGIILGRAQKTGGVDNLVEWAWDGEKYVFTDLNQPGDGLSYNRNNINESNGHHSTTFISTLNFGYRAGVKGPIECPEPSILLMLSAALFGLGMTAKRRLLK